MFKMLMLHLCLASKSPRRFQILFEAGYRVCVVTVKVSEIIEENLNLDEALSKLAMTKAQRAWDLDNSLKSGHNLIVGADTVVVFDGRILGQPKDADQAFKFLSQMSGKKHCVKTSVALINCESKRKDNTCGEHRCVVSSVE